MRLKKHLILLLAPIALFAALFLPSQAFAQSGTYVFDEMNVLSSSEFSELESMGASYASKYNVGVYLLFTDSMGSNQDSGSGRREFARDYFVAHDLGVGSNKDGIILVIAVQARKYVTVKHFVDSSTDPFSDDSVDTMESDVKDELKDNNWYKGGSVYYKTIGNHMEYFAQNGEQWTSPHVMATLIKLGATVLIPLLAALGITNSNKNAMLTARMQTEASNYVDQGSFALTTQSDIFLNRTVTSTPRPKHDDNDGGGWSDMGGGFSGSDGGDF